MSGNYKEFTYESQGWAGSRFERQTTTVQVRRVQRDGRDEVQMEISIAEIKRGSGKMYRHHGSLTLTPEQAEVFSNAVLRPYSLEEIPAHMTNTTENAIETRSSADCTCYHTCRSDSRSGTWHQHENEPCPIHPNAPMVG